MAKTQSIIPKKVSWKDEVKASVKGNPKPNALKIKNYYYPNKGNPQFSVEPVTDGYKFSLYEGGKIKGQFPLDKKTLENAWAASGFEGEEAMAIELFRKHLGVSRNETKSKAKKAAKKEISIEIKL